MKSETITNPNILMNHHHYRMNARCIDWIKIVVSDVCICNCRISPLFHPFSPSSHRFKTSTSVTIPSLFSHHLNSIRCPHCTHWTSHTTTSSLSMQQAVFTHSIYHTTPLRNALQLCSIHRCNGSTSVRTGTFQHCM